MPLLYARAVFESSLADVWRKNFDDRVDVLRALLAERAFPESADHICAVEGLSRKTQSGIIG